MTSSGVKPYVWQDLCEASIMERLIERVLVVAPISTIQDDVQRMSLKWWLYHINTMIWCLVNGNTIIGLWVSRRFHINIVVDKPGPSCHQSLSEQYLQVVSGVSWTTHGLACYATLGDPSVPWIIGLDVVLPAWGTVCFTVCLARKKGLD